MLKGVIWEVYLNGQEIACVMTKRVCTQLVAYQGLVRSGYDSRIRIRRAGKAGEALYPLRLGR